MNESSVWLDLDQITARLCVVTSEQLGLKLEQVKPESRLIEDLNCDSLDLIELIMETEDEFGITIPETPATPVGKLIFTRQPFRIRDLAEYVFFNQGTGKPLRSGLPKKPIELPPAAESGFTQLGGRFNSGELQNANLYEKLDATGEYPMFRRVTDGMVCVELPTGSVEVGNSDEEAHDDERPRHSITLSSFLIDIEPVSVTALSRPAFEANVVVAGSVRSSCAAPATVEVATRRPGAVVWTFDASAIAEAIKPGLDSVTD